MINRTELKVIDVAHLSRKDTSVVSVEILKGGPLLNIQLISPDAPGRWQVVGIGHLPADYSVSHPNSMALNVLNLDEGKQIRAGINLVEAE